MSYVNIIQNSDVKFQEKFTNGTLFRDKSNKVKYLNQKLFEKFEKRDLYPLNIQQVK